MPLSSGISMAAVFLGIDVMSDNGNNVVAPWYKQPWLWFILAPLIVVVFVGMTLLYLAITTADGLVTSDHSRVVRGYEVDSTKSRAAAEMGISANLQLDNLTGDLMLLLKSDQSERPNELILDIASPTHKKYDQTITLKKVPSSEAYTGSLKSALQGKRNIILEPVDGSWRLSTQSYPPYDQKTIELTPSLER